MQVPALSDTFGSAVQMLSEWIRHNPELSAPHLGRAGLELSGKSRRHGENQVSVAIQPAPTLDSPENIRNIVEG